MALTEDLVGIPDGNVWTVLNSTDAETIQFVNRGSGSAEIARSDATPPADGAAAFPCGVGAGTDPRAIADVIHAPTGGRIWARSLNGTTFAVTWS